MFANNTPRTHGNTPARFNITDPQRYMSIPEASRIADCRRTLSVQARGLYLDLVTLRTEQTQVIASKKFLLPYTGIKSLNTLNSRLAELEAAGLIRTWKIFTKSETFCEPTTRHFIAFPYFEKSLPTWDYDLETTTNPLPDCDCDLITPDEPSNGRGSAFFDAQESYGNKIINNPDIPPPPNPGFPQPTPDPAPVSTPPVEEGGGETPEPAVFLTKQPEPEISKPVSPPPPMVEEPVKPLTEDLGKDEPQVIAAINDLVMTIKREKNNTGLVKTLADDVVCLKKAAGALPVLTGLKCMMETLPTVKNPGGWLRVHLNNPAWLNRFRAKLEERRDVEQANEQSYQMTMARLAAETKQAEAEERNREEVERLIAGLSAFERESLFTEARAILTEKRGLITERSVRAIARVLARKKFPASSGPLVDV